MTLPVQTNFNTSIGSTRLVTFTEHTVNTYIFPLLLPNRGKIHLVIPTEDLRPISFGPNDIDNIDEAAGINYLFYIHVVLNKVKIKWSEQLNYILLSLGRRNGVHRKYRCQSQAI
jgi:hypothetical protein